MEGTTPKTSEPKARHAAARADSGRSLSCFSVDENVQDLLWDEDVQMEELLNFSFDHIDKLAERRGKTISTTEKWRLWDYVQRMKREQPYWVTKESVPWEELEAKYMLRSRSLSSDSLPGSLQFSRSGLSMPTPRLHSLRKPLGRKGSTASRGAAATQASLCINASLLVAFLDQQIFVFLLHHRAWMDGWMSCLALTATLSSQDSSQLPEGLNCEPDERFTLSEQWDAGSPHRGHVLSATCPKKKQGWQRLLGKVFNPKPKSSVKDSSIPEFDSFVAASNSPSRCSRYEGSPSPPNVFQKQRPTGFLRRSLRKVTMAARKHD
ncbi:hypothetical protein HPB50_009673 [Hyalomma asiaticum]|uniref:Uncharacterized protein n=1 Tax=Hyalomma asiaticum TaxID=266040 RepID=A0ACB7THK6_HYAAI|nr:hypothetical protein HPB50_009673 [Hyalomma asiaticum]